MNPIFACRDLLPCGGKRVCLFCKQAALVCVLLLQISAAHAQWTAGQPLAASPEETDQLLERAQRAQEQYPWVIQEMRGLTFQAYNLPREEFLRGIHAVTDLIIEGTEELPGQVTVFGFFPNISSALDKATETDLSLKHKLDAEHRTLQFFRPPDPTSGLSPMDLVSRYRREPIRNAQVPGGRGAWVPGILVVDGTLFPPPYLIEIVPNQPGSNILVLANGYPVEKLDYTDPVKIEQDILNPQSPEAYRSAFHAKCNQVWLQVSQIPFATTGERLNLMAGQMNFLYGIHKTKVVGEKIEAELMNGTVFEWSIAHARGNASLTEQSAYQKAYERQNEILAALGGGAVVFCSLRFGPHSIQDGYTFQTQFNELLAKTDLTLAQKEQEIRLRWERDADWLLEYFYTSLSASEVPSAPPPNPQGTGYAPTGSALPFPPNQMAPAVNPPQQPFNPFLPPQGQYRQPPFAQFPAQQQFPVQGEPSLRVLPPASQMQPVPPAWGQPPQDLPPAAASIPSGSNPAGMNYDLIRRILERDSYQR